METKKKMINQLDVEIKHGLITSITCELKTSGEGEPKASWTIRGHYLTGNNLKVAEFTYWSESYSKEHELDLGEHEAFINAKMADIFESFTGILYTKVNGTFAKLAKGKVDSSDAPF